MSTVMADERVRTVILLPEDHRDALRLESVKQKKDMADIIKELIEKEFGDSLAEIKRVRRKKPHD